MIALGFILMVVGGAIFAAGEQKSCVLLIIGTAVNIIGLGMIISAL